jgi:hypothetical protein
MKKILSVVVLFVLVLLNTTLSAQEYSIEESSGQVGTTTPFILYGGSSNGFFKGYALSDGAPLSYKDLQERLKLVPENEVLLRRATGWRIAGWINIAAVAGCAVAAGVYAFNQDLTNANETATVFGSLGLSLSGLELGFWLLSQDNIAKAINNYNAKASVGGCPVPAR